MEAHLCFINSTVRLFRIECIVDARRGNAMSKERRWYDLKISVDAYQLGRSIASKEELQRTKKDLKLFQTLSSAHLNDWIKLFKLLLSQISKIYYYKQEYLIDNM